MPNKREEGKPDLTALNIMGVKGGVDKLEPDQVWKLYEKGVEFNAGINLDETVRVNENFFIGKQWEGVKSNGLPTPVFNIIKRCLPGWLASPGTRSPWPPASRSPRSPGVRG